MKLRSARTLRALCFDLENRPLAYWYDGATTSQITAFGWKWRDEPDAEALLLQANGLWRFGSRTLKPEIAYGLFRLLLLEADVVYGHNIRRHDLPIFQAGLERLRSEERRVGNECTA